MHSKLLIQILLSIMVFNTIGCSSRIDNAIKSKGSYWKDKNEIIYYFDLLENKIGFGRSKVDALEMANKVSQEFKSNHEVLDIIKISNGKVEIIIPGSEYLVAGEFYFIGADNDKINFSIIFKTQPGVSDFFQEPWVEILKSHNTTILSDLDSKSNKNTFGSYLIVTRKYVEAFRLK